MAGNPRNGRPYRRLCDQQRAMQYPCWICGTDIDYSLTGPEASKHPLAFTLDHLLPVSKRPDLLLDPANARSAHRRCNSRRGNRMTVKTAGASRRW
ncbi:HNH endonuclease [Streptomyces sp. HNM0645]|uniref:HNH endonuclease n=1 Tax=Streptomyces sp. HNM0645 TaxID=2782343 RepID=UPI0024B709F8|nr:HNH endonuclease [Streptomyces sp. HNM0645]MDI9885918.1 HNH endonuclease [Streptomyces sp. HNM0645]